MNNYLIILATIAYSNTISFERMVKEYRCDQTALQVMIVKGIIEKYDRDGGNVVMLSLKGRKLYQSLDSVVDMAMFS